MRSSSTLVPQLTPSTREARRASSRDDSGTMRAVPRRISPAGALPSPKAAAIRPATSAANMGRSSDGGPGRATTRALPTLPEKPGAVPFGLGMSGKPCGRRGLLPVGLRDHAALEPVQDALPRLGVKHELHAGGSRDDLPGEVIRGGAQPARDHHEVGFSRRPVQLGAEQRLAVGNLHATQHRETQRRELRGQEAGMGVLDDALGQLGSRRNDDGGPRVTHSGRFS